ncbi:MAG: hypothetical protein K0Q48_72 [Bacillota bacterium]|nr:hypothetical protein [Bacillota bacterium]
MNAEELLKTMFRSFFVITTGALTSMFVFCLILYPEARFTLHDIGRILLMAAFTDLAFLIFYSGKELGKKQMYLRQAVHLPVLLAIVLYLAGRWDWVNLNRVNEVFVFLSLFLVVYAVVCAITAYQDKKLADRLNRSLRERYRS